MSGADLELVLEGNELTLRVKVIGELVTSNCSDLREMVIDVSRRKPELIVVDMEETTFMDTSGLGVLVGLRAHLRSRKIDFMLSNPSPKVKQVLRMTRLLPVFGLSEED